MRSGVELVANSSQALGLRPWLAALPLRERRLRARLLMLCSNKMGGRSIARTGTIPAIMAYKEVGGRPGRIKPREMAIVSKSAQTDKDDCNR